MRKIRITAQKSRVSMTASLNNSDTANDVWNALPVTSVADLYGREVYFPVPVKAPEEDAQPQVPSGTVAYWPPGMAMCLFFGQTPYSPVNILGYLEGDPLAWAKVRRGEPITVEKVEAAEAK